MKKYIIAGVCTVAAFLSEFFNAPGSTVYISGTVYEQIKDRITVSEVGEIPLKGKSKGVFVYSVTGISNYED